MIWSPHSYNPETKTDGNWVMTLEECDIALDKRREKGGDLSPENILAEQERFYKSIGGLQQ